MENLSHLGNQPPLLVEYKEHPRLISRLLEVVAGFANDYCQTGGGYLVCGLREITQGHNLTKLESGGLPTHEAEALRSELTTGAKTLISPALELDIDEYFLTRRYQYSVLVVTVPASRHLHYLADSGGKKKLPIRLGRQQKQASLQEERSLKNRKISAISWEHSINQQSTIADLDGIELKNILKHMGRWNAERPFNDFLSEDERLDKFLPPMLGRNAPITPLHPLNFAVVSLGKAPHEKIKGAFITLQTFADNEGLQSVGEHTVITGNIFEQANTAVNLLSIEAVANLGNSEENRHLKEPYLPSFPEKCIREAVINALSHRDYQIDRPINIHIFPDRIQITSPGAKPEMADQVWEENKTGPAFFRNQAIHRLFFLMGFTAYNGKGMDVIKNEMRINQFPEPEFVSGPDFFSCVFKRNN